MGPNTQKQAASIDTVTEYHTEFEVEFDGHKECGQGDGNIVSGDEDEVEEEEEDAEAEAEAEAEEIARRLNDQLWAEISKARAEAAAASSKDTIAAPTGTQIFTNAPAEADTIYHVPLDRRVHEALKTMRIILKDIANDPLARSTLSNTLIPGPDVSVLDAFNNAVSSNAIRKEIARPLSHLLVSLARSDVLFSSLKHSEESSIQLQLGKGKRQRDDDEQDVMNDDEAPPSLKRHSRHSVRAAVPPLLPMHYTLHSQLDGASRAIISALTGPAAPPTGPPPPLLIASIQFPLHQVFLFAMTASGPARNMLQEVGGLIQALGVLTGIPIGGPSSPSTNNNNNTAWGHPGTSVHPCSFPGCGKTFARLYSLRAHTTRVHAAERPFRCTRCPAAFARNHDLKRHERLHDDRAWQCTGCAKSFSRRDALTRHRNTAAARHSACATADVAEIDMPKSGAGAIAALEDETRRTAMWYDAAPGATGTGTTLEEGELPRPVLVAAHEAVARLHTVLRACVARALGGDSGGAAVASKMPLGHMATAASAAAVDTDPTGGQVTLASALARAQAHSSGTALNLIDMVPVCAVADAGGGAGPLTNAGGSSLYGLSPELTIMLDRAIASASSAARLQAEAEAALEEEEEVGEPSEGEGR
jgi:Zinc finger, C2H2 type